ncbi:MAG: lysylphosphatidylglycerol synthase transmembrane domain-containing protein [Anaerolineae bacterium]
MQMPKGWPRLLILLVIGGFFAYRWWALGGVFHVVAAVVYILVTVTGLVQVGDRKLPVARYQTLALNVGISLVFLDLVFARVEWDLLREALAGANYWMMLPSFALVVVSLFLRTWRWQWLLRAVGRVPFGPAFRAANIGIGANMVLPARAGEFLRAYVVGRSTGVSKAGAFATLVVERILDGLTILLSLVGVILLGVRSPELKQIGAIGGVFYAGALAGVSVFYFRQTWFTALVKRILPETWAKRATTLLESFANGLAVLRDGRQLLLVSLQSLLIWFVIACSFYPVLLAFDFGAPAPLFTPFLLLPLMALGLTIPGAPGGVGILQYVIVLALQLSFAAVGAEQSPDFAEQAAAFSLALHFSQAAPEILLGAWAFLAEGLSWGEVEMGREAATS